MSAGLPKEAHAPWDRLIDNHIETGRMDLVKDLANPLPTMITLELLGLPASEWRRFAEPSNLFPSSPPGSQDRARAEHGMAWIYEQIQERCLQLV
jgi:cytochrome P450